MSTDYTPNLLQGVPSSSRINANLNKIRDELSQKLDRRERTNNELNDDLDANGFQIINLDTSNLLEDFNDDVEAAEDAAISAAADADIAEAAAIAAAASEDNAGDSEDNAAGYASSASGSATDASNSATAASDSEAAVSGYADAASGYADDASDSADAAASSASNASIAENSAGNHATAASGYRIDAAASAASASDDADSAEDSASNAAASASDANDSADAAADSAASINPTAFVRKDDADISANDWFLDEDDLSSDSATKAPSQQSVKAYVDANTGGDGTDWGGIGGTLADQTDLQDALDDKIESGDNVSSLVNDADYVSEGDNISDLTNDADYVASSGVSSIVFVTQAEYDGLTPVSTTLYFIEAE